MPGFQLDGKHVIWFAVTKKHLGVYPRPRAIDEYRTRIGKLGYGTTKGAIQIKWGQTVDWDLIRDIVMLNINSIE
jgi:uncharacterized protein YdhG (YjbR/CyaY superfamily)